MHGIMPSHGSAVRCCTCALWLAQQSKHVWQLCARLPLSFSSSMCPMARVFLACVVRAGQTWWGSDWLTRTSHACSSSGRASAKDTRGCSALNLTRFTSPAAEKAAVGPLPICSQQSSALYSDVAICACMHACMHDPDALGLGVACTSNWCALQRVAVHANLCLVESQLALPTS